MQRDLISRVLAFAVIAVVAAHPAGAQAITREPPRVRSATGEAPKVFGTIDGAVTDSNLVPIHAAFVSILGTNIRVGTGPNGRFRIVRVPAGRYLVVVKRVGYRPTSGVVEVPASDTLRLSYTLEQVTELEAVRIVEQSASARMGEFEARRRVGWGEFMTADEIEQRNSVFATELFRKFTSINVSPSRTSSMTEYYPLSKREGGTLSLGACPMQVYVDQVAMPSPFNLDLLPPPRDLAGIEVYSGASTTPPQFSGFNRGCGVILVWTKDR
jgi:Carboxypeptidase regulatory-like domain